MFAQKYYNSTALSMWVVHTCMVWWNSHICKVKFLSIYFHICIVKFSEQHRVSDRVKLTKRDKLNGVKNAIMQVTYFLNSPMFNLLFYCHVILYWEKVTSYEKFSHNLILEGQILLCLWKKSFLADIYRNIEKETFAFKVLQDCSS